MAYIDMKNCQFFIEDGYSIAGAVNLMAGYPAGATSLVVDGFGASVSVETGTLLHFAGHATMYKIVSHTETSATTTGIVISPPLTDPVVDNEVVTAGPHILELKIGEGNCTYNEKRPLEYKKNRGLLDQVRLGDQEPIDVNLQFAWEFITSKSGDTVPSVEDFVKREGPAAAYTTVDTDCSPYAVNLVIVQSQISCGSETEPVERIVLPKFRYTELAHDPKAGTVTMQGTCNTTKALRSRLASAQG